MKRSSGFSLMELLVVAALLPILSFALFANFSAATRLWKALQRETPEEDLAILYQKMSRDLEGVFFYTPIRFGGDAEGFSCATLIHAPSALGGERAIGRVDYRYDTGHKTFLRDEFNVSELYKGEEEKRPGRVILPGVSSASFGYFFQDPSDKRCRWTDEWNPENKFLPIALRVDFEYRHRVYSRTFWIPTGKYEYPA